MPPRTATTATTPPSGPRPSRRVPWWAVASAALAPVAMIGGWTLAAARQTDFDAVRETISALAAAPSADPGVMTAGLAVTGACHVVTAAGLRSLPPLGRALLALGGVATAAVAALPVDVAPQAHGVAAAVGFGALTLWPAGAWRRAGGDDRGDRADRADGGGLHPAVAAIAVTGLAASLAWFVLELQHLTPDDGSATGLSERVLAGAQSLWPLATVVLVGTARARAGRAARERPHAPAGVRAEQRPDQ